MTNTRATFIPEGYYHVYNMTNGGEKLFQNDENRRYFLSRFAVYIKPYFYVHAYALMSNHFHFSLAVKPKGDILNHLQKIDKEQRTNLMQKVLDLEDVGPLQEVRHLDLHLLLCEQFKRIFTSYTKAYNNYLNRRGSLFRQKFKRSQYDPNEKFRYLQYYIHHNARKHGVVKNFDAYKHTSYHEILGEMSHLSERSDI